MRTSRVNIPLNIVGRWNIFLFCLIVFGATSVSISYYWMAFIAFVVCYIALRVGAGFVPAERSTTWAQHKKVRTPTKRMVFLALVSAGASVYASFFYTGKSLEAVALAFLQNESAYNSYQSYIADQSLTSFTSDQVLPFAAGIFVRLTFLYSIFLLWVKNANFKFLDFVAIAISAFSFAYQGISRGTSIEIFEIALYFIVCQKYRELIFPVKGSNTLRIIVTAALVLGAAGLFYYNQAARYEFGGQTGCITNELCFDHHSLIHEEENFLSILVYRLNGYFSFGMYFLASYLKIWMQSDWGALAIFLPAEIVSGISSREMICRNVVDCGANWVPDIAVSLDSFGILGTVLLLVALGVLSRKVMKELARQDSFLWLVLCYYITVTSVSLFVGNFVFSSRASVASLILIIGLLFLRRRINRLVPAAFF